MKTLTEVIIALKDREATIVEATVLTVTASQRENSTGFMLGLDTPVKYIDKNNEEVETDVIFVSNIGLAITLGLMPPAFKLLAGNMKNDRSGNLATLLLCGAKITIAQERLDMGVEYIDEMTGSAYTPKTDQYYNYITDIKPGDPNFLSEYKKMMMQVSMQAMMQSMSVAK